MKDLTSISRIILVSVACFCLIVLAVGASGKKQKTVPCDPSHAQLVKVAVGRLTVIDFPMAPKQILPGENRFQFVRIQNDLDIKALQASGSTNVVVYMKERRCSFDLKIVPRDGDDIVYVRDAKDEQIDWDVY